MGRSGSMLVEFKEKGAEVSYTLYYVHKNPFIRLPSYTMHNTCRVNVLTWVQFWRKITCQPPKRGIVQFLLRNNKLTSNYRNISCLTVSFKHKSQMCSKFYHTWFWLTLYNITRQMFENSLNSIQGSFYNVQM